PGWTWRGIRLPVARTHGQRIVALLRWRLLLPDRLPATQSADPDVFISLRCPWLPHGGLDATGYVKVRFLIAQFHPRVGGAERQALLQARTLAALGHEVVVHTLRYQHDWPVREIVDGIQVRRHGAVVIGGRLRLGHGLQWLTGLVVFAALARARRQFDALHVHQLSWLALVGAWVALLLRKPVVVKVGSTSTSALAPT